MLFRKSAHLFRSVDEFEIIKYKAYELKQEDANLEKREISGLASTFGNKDLDGDIILPEAFREQFDHRPLHRIKTLWQHSRSDPVGLGIAELTETNMPFRTKIATGIEVAEKALQSAAQGLVDAFSIGFLIPKGGIIFDKTEDAFLISKAILKEVSLVTFPANPPAEISDVKSKEDVIEIRQYMTALLREAGYSIGLIKAAFAGTLSNLPGVVDNKDYLELTNHINEELKKL